MLDSLDDLAANDGLLQAILDAIQASTGDTFVSDKEKPSVQSSTGKVCPDNWGSDIVQLAD